MTTPVFLTGFEYGIQSPNANGGGLFNFVASPSPNVEIVSTEHKTGTYALKLNPDGTQDAYVRKTLSSNTVVGRHYFKVETNPAASSILVSMTCTTSANTPRIYLNPSTNVVELRAGTTVIATGSSYTTGVWYCLDWSVDVSANPWQLKAKINGGTEFSGSSAQAADTITGYQIGTSSTAAWVSYVDDVVVSYTLADYPIGEGGTEILLPTSDGTHNAGTNIMENQAGADIGVVTAYDLIDDIPMTTATTYIRQAAVGTGNYATINFGNITATHSGIIGAMAVLAYTSETTSANTAGCIVSKDSFSTSTTVHGATGALADYSEGATNNLYYKSVIVAGAVDDTTVNALAARMGYAGDATPDPYWVNLAVEVAYTVSTGIVGTLNKTLGSLTETITGTVVTSGITNKTLGSLTETLSGTVLVSSTTNKTLGSLTETINTTVLIQTFTSKTLGSLVLSSSGSVADAEITCSLNKALGSLTSISDTTVLIQGVTSKTLNSLIDTISSTVLVQSSTNKTLDSLTENISTNVVVQGSTNKTLNSLSENIAGNTLIQANTIKTLGTINRVILGGVVVQSITSKTLGNITKTIAGNVLIQGASTITLDGIDGNILTNVVVGGGLFKNLDSIFGVISGDTVVAGQVSKTLGALTISATGSIGTVVSTGILDEVLGSLNISSSSTNLVTGVTNKPLGLLASESSGDISVLANLSKTLGESELSSQSNVLIKGMLEKSLGILTLVSTVFPTAYGTTNEVLGSLSSNIDGTTMVSGTLSENLQSLIGTSSGQIIVQGYITKTLGNVVLVSIGIAPVSGNVSKNLSSLASTSQGKVFIFSNTDKTLSNIGSMMLGDVEVKGVANNSLGEMLISSSGIVSNAREGILIATLGAVAINATGTVFDSEKYYNNLFVLDEVEYNAIIEIKKETPLFIHKIEYNKTNIKKIEELISSIYKIIT